MFAEIIFETGSKSIAQVDSEAELQAFLTEHQRRAINGEVGGPTGHPAERITKVLLYKEHPGDLMADGLVSTQNVKALVDGMDKDGRLNVHQLSAALRDEVSPVYPQDQGRHNSMYKQQENGEFDLSFLKNEAA